MTSVGGWIYKKVSGFVGWLCFIVFAVIISLIFILVIAISDFFEWVERLK